MQVHNDSNPNNKGSYVYLVELCLFSKDFIANKKLGFFKKETKWNQIVLLAEWSVFLYAVTLAIMNIHKNDGSIEERW